MKAYRRPNCKHPLVNMSSYVIPGESSFIKQDCMVYDNSTVHLCIYVYILFLILFLSMRRHHRNHNHDIICFRISNYHPQSSEEGGVAPPPQPETKYKMTRCCWYWCLFVLYGIGVYSCCMVLVYICTINKTIASSD